MMVVPASLLRKHSLFAVGLCLLAMLFAVEAKTAWYNPGSGTSCEISAAKAWPVDTPEVISHAISAPEAFHPLVPFALLATLSATLLTLGALSSRMKFARKAQEVSTAAFFSPHLFLRPPTTR